MLNSLPKHLHKKEMQQWHDAIESAAITLKDGTAVEDNDVHQLRKYNKDLMYVSDYIPAPAQSKEIAEITGRFMDNTILLQILEERKQDIPHKELKILQDAAKDWYMQKENKLAQVKQLLATSR